MRILVSGLGPDVARSDTAGSLPGPVAPLFAGSASSHGS